MLTSVSALTKGMAYMNSYDSIYHLLIIIKKLIYNNNNKYSHVLLSYKKHLLDGIKNINYMYTFDIYIILYIDI